MLQLVLAGMSVLAAADELVAEIHLEPLAGLPDQSQSGFEPLWQLSPDGGPVYDVVEDSDFLVTAHSRTAEVQLVSSIEPLVVSLSTESADQVWIAAPVGATMLVEGSTSRTVTVQFDGAAVPLVEPLVAQPNQALQLPIESMAEPGWLIIQARETGQQIHVLKIDSAFLTGQTRLRGSGRLVIEFEGEVVHNAASEVELSLGLWFRGREICAPDSEGTVCDWLRTGTASDGTVTLAPVALDDNEWSLLSEGP